ncbi:hypothetical protein M011DRAFT_399 [Sporormia fimetaria CBS 119925]|uniref:Uncharacterized protein n=1 Tax=Sporormia fimetaria CBS 119925 TaxID=1340428 RepID=A0A6A6VPD7_9PLEO|nr:hypothetical protein M011DRAFT_399 [Sporormia fimetaria CBS 119925]
MFLWLSLFILDVFCTISKSMCHVGGGRASRRKDRSKHICNPSTSRVYLTPRPSIQS